MRIASGTTSRGTDQSLSGRSTGTGRTTRGSVLRVMGPAGRPQWRNFPSAPSRVTVPHKKRRHSERAVLRTRHVCEERKSRGISERRASNGDSVNDSRPSAPALQCYFTQLKQISTVDLRRSTATSRPSRLQVQELARI